MQRQHLFHGVDVWRRALDQIESLGLPLHVHIHVHPLATVLVLVEPAKEKRRPDDRLPEEILLDRPSIVIGPCMYLCVYAQVAPPATKSIASTD